MDENLHVLGAISPFSGNWVAVESECESSSGHTAYAFNHIHFLVSRLRNTVESFEEIM